MSKNLLIAFSLASLFGCSQPGTAPSDSGSTPTGPGRVPSGATDAGGTRGPTGVPVSGAPDLSSPGTPDLTAANPQDGAGPPAPDLAGPAQAQAPAHHRCGWLQVTDPAGKASFLANASWFDAIHPDWYAMNSDGITIRPILATDDPDVLAAATQNHVQVIPLVASVENTAWTRTMLYSAQNRTAHIQTLVQTAVSHGYAGLDLDYEHLWDSADAAPLQAFIQEFATAMHGAGKLASMAVPALDSMPQPIWNYANLAASLDQVHVMAYDFHTIGTHAGPTSPLGWIDAVAAQAQATGAAGKFVLGLPNYGVTSTSACPLATCAASCTGALATSTDHMLTCPFGNYTAGRSLNCDTAAGALFFDDTQSLEEKVMTVQSHGLGGVTYWTVGNEPAGFLAMVRKYY